MAISRQELKSDQFVSTLDNWYEFYLNYQKQIQTAAIVVAVAIAAGVGLTAWVRNRDARAEALFSQGLATLHAPLAGAATAAPGVTTYANAQARAQAAEKFFQQAADSYASTESGREAKYYLGLIAIERGDTAKGEAVLKAVAAGKDARVASLAENALANLYATQGKTNEARALYQKLIANPSVVVPRSLAMIELADLEAVNDPGAARKLYEQIQQQFPDSDLARTAQDSLAALAR
ncbi:MAG TPA: tetratricopeptide repeat protein [Terriglobales bacterium]|nr:tetratricopeptide repeat protein [Terriglobales bacterium]